MVGLLRAINVVLEMGDFERIDELKKYAGLTWREVLEDWYKLKSEKLSDEDWKALKKAKKKLQGE